MIRQTKRAARYLSRKARDVYDTVKVHTNKVLTAGAGGGGAVVAADQALASGGPSADLGIDVDTMLTGAATDIGGYVAWGIGLAIAVIAIWKVKKYVAKAG
jgi:hypothetical protein